MVTCFTAGWSSCWNSRQGAESNVQILEVLLYFLPFFCHFWWFCQPTESNGNPTEVIQDSVEPIEIPGSNELLLSSRPWISVSNRMHSWWRLETVGVLQAASFTWKLEGDHAGWKTCFCLTDGPVSCASVTRCCKMYHCVKTLLWNALYRVSTIYCFNMICYNMIRWHFTNVWSTSCHFNPPSAQHTEVTKNIIMPFESCPSEGEFGHASAWFLCPGFPGDLWCFPYMAPTGVSTGGKPKVDVVSLDSGEASLAAGPPRPEANCGSCFFLEGKMLDLWRSGKIWGPGHVFIMVCVLNQYGYGSKWLEHIWNLQTQ